MILSVAILLLVTLQRVAEVAWARRNARRLLARGAVESGEEHYPILVGLHAAWLAGLWWLAWDRPADLWLLGAYLLVQPLRIWTLASLGPRWTTRILTLPGEPPERRGPHRFVPYPYYVVLVLEVALLPLVFGLGAFALVFTFLNASALVVRIRAEADARRRAEL